MSLEILNNKENQYTKKEILRQPGLWKEVYKMLIGQKDPIHQFLNPIFRKPNLRIVLTGAGSSAFIGEAAQGIVQQATHKVTQAIASTDIVSHPELFLLKRTPTLLVSFARSGNSPESLEAVELANTYCNEIYHFIITCSSDGKLATYGSSQHPNCYSLVLPENSNDRSLAMTGSFTSMLFSALLVFDITAIQTKKDFVATMIGQGNEIIDQSNILKKIAKKQFERVVFLGSGPMLGIARESHLKLQELSDGKIICKHDSFLGFRHGPRAVANDKTLMVYLFSEDEHAFKYEKDLVKSIDLDPRNIASISVNSKERLSLKNNTSLDSKYRDSGGLSIVATTLVGQLLGYFKSIHLGLNPDNPSVSGAISRVVQGVTIYTKNELK